MPSRAPLNLLPNTRRLLLLGIKERGEATAEELARASFLSIAAVRMHLYGLETEGFVTHFRRREGPGRPTHVFRLTAEGEELLPQGYAVVAMALLNAVDATGAPKDTLIEAILVDQCARVRETVVAPTVEGRIAQLAEVQELQGYFPAWEQISADCWVGSMGHCPFIRVARKHPEFCEMERVVIETALAAGAVERLSSRASGEPRCAYQLRLARGEGTPRRD